MVSIQNIYVYSWQIKYPQKNNHCLLAIKNANFFLQQKRTKTTKYMFLNGKTILQIKELVDRKSIDENPESNTDLSVLFSVV